MKIRTDQPLMQDQTQITHMIANFWNQISEGWRKIWGPHIHHGFYEENELATPLEAQEKLIEKLSQMLHIRANDQILDVGCGMGGSSLYLAKKYQANITGITLSKKQVAIATQQARIENIDTVNFKIENALSLASIPDQSVDLVWSLESCEQFYDKNLFLQQAFRVLKPGGQLMLATWCSDREEYENQFAKKYQKLCVAFDLPYMPTIGHYSSRIEAQGFTLTDSFDWSPHVKKSWDVGVSLVHLYSFIQLLRMGGWRGLKFARQVKLMQEAFHNGSVRYGVFLAKKP